MSDHPTVENIDDKVNSIFHRMSTRALRDAPTYLSHVSEVKQEVKALIASERQKAELEAYSLLYWKYKELNHQSVDIKFAEAYGILTDEMNSASLKDTHTGEE